MPPADNRPDPMAVFRHEDFWLQWRFSVIYNPALRVTMELFSLGGRLACLL
jgi:hypothetical protein